MHCQELYWDDHRCPHMIQVRLKRAKREALSSPSMRGAPPKKSLLGSLIQRTSQNLRTLKIRDAVDVFRRRLP
jgi:hypothetical protein